MQLDILLRGQSNAILLAEQDRYAAMAHLDSEVQRLLGFDGKTDNINVVFDRYGEKGVTAVGGTGLLTDWMQQDAAGNWQAGRLEKELLKYIDQHPSEAPVTAVLWLHSEYDSANRSITADKWEAAVRADAALVRDALGKDAASAPYMFVSAFPYGSGTDAGHQAIRLGMEELAADPAFGGHIAARAQDLNMATDNQDGNWSTTEYGGGHFSPEDGMLVAHRAAQSIAEAFAAYAKPGSPIALANGNIDNLGPEVVTAQRSAPDTLLVDVRHDAAAGFSALNEAAAGGLGWSVRLGDSVVRADAAQVVDADTLQLHFGAALPDGASLFYAYGQGRLATGNTPGQGNAVYDDHGLPIWTPASGVALDAPAAPGVALPPVQVSPAPVTAMAEVAAAPEPVPPPPVVAAPSYGEQLAAILAAHSGILYG